MEGLEAVARMAPALPWLSLGPIMGQTSHSLSPPLPPPWETHGYASGVFGGVAGSRGA